VHRTRLPEPWRLLGHPLWRRQMRRRLAHGLRVLPLPQAGHDLASPPRSAGRLSRTVGGHHMISRSQRGPPTVRCHRPASGDCTSIRVWCSHVCLAPGHGNQVRTRHRLLAARGSHGGKKRKNPLSGKVCLLTRRGLIRVRPGLPPEHRLLCFSGPRHRRVIMPGAEVEVTAPPVPRLVCRPS
jgi:hypothetical protein